MAMTAKPISTITYNTEGFLFRQLNAMLESGRISDYRVIHHIGEVDKQTGKKDKDHWHLWLEPNKRTDSHDIESMFIEQDPHNDKPLRSRKFRPSDGGHWIMYVLHDAEYLRNHDSDNDGDGKIPYLLEDIKTPYPDDLEADYRRAIHLRETDNQKVIKAIQAGQSATQILYETGINPMKVRSIMQLIDPSGIEWLKQDDKRIEQEQTEDLPY